MLRFGDSINDLFVFEAMDQVGVRMLSWDTLRLHFKYQYEKIGYRKLNGYLTEERLDELERLRCNAIGH